jgi:hypothetical protein
MRSVPFVLLVLSACDPSPGDSGSICGEAPLGCSNGCEISVEVFDDGEDCCDTTVCNCVPSTQTWEVHSCDFEADTDAGSPCGAPPAECVVGCLIEVESFDYEDCCDSTTCNCRPSTHEWEVSYCDPPPTDGGGEYCDGCTPGQVCVLHYDGTCQQSEQGQCVDTTCTACTPECDLELCGFGGDAGSVYSCGAAPCEELPDDGSVFACYGV